MVLSIFSRAEIGPQQSLLAKPVSDGNRATSTFTCCQRRLKGAVYIHTKMFSYD